MNKVLRFAHSWRTATLTFLTAAAVLVAAGAATAAYSGTTSSGEILTCFARSTGALRVVDHLPCKKGEQELRWNSRGRDGAARQPGTDGRPGADGERGAAGPAGPAGQTGTAGRDGNDGAAGTAGPTGSPGPAGIDGAAGPAGATGAAGTPGADGPRGPSGADGKPGNDGAAGPAGAEGQRGLQGPAGPAGRGSGMQFGQVTNHSDPDCTMVGPIGRTAGAACSFGAIQGVGEYLPASTVISGFRVLLDRTVSTPTDIIARTLDPSSSAPVDAFVLCTVPAGSNTCAQTGERTLTGPNLFALQMSGNRTWSKARFGYSLVQG